MFISVDRGPDESPRAGLDDPEDVGHLHIHIAGDVSPGECTRVLFESGAAVQQANADYLISADWLRRQAAAKVRDLLAWDRQFAEFVASAAGATSYIKSVDAVRANVTCSACTHNGNCAEKQDWPWLG